MSDQLQVYVAGSIHDIPYVRRIQHVCRLKDWHITFDWTGADGDIRAAWSNQRSRAREIGNKELKAVWNSDLLIWLYHERSFGATMEFAFGAANAVPTWIVGCPRDSIFFYLNDNIERVKDEQELVTKIADY